jgi:hypothetical protein
MITQHRKLLSAFIGLAFILLSGCIPGTMSITAEQAAVNIALQSMSGMPGTVINQNSIQVRQSQAIDNRKFVLLTFSRSVQGRIEDCVGTYEVSRTNLGVWRSESGGSGCKGSIGGAAEPEEPMEIGGGRTGQSGPNDPGYSNVNGIAHNKDIVKVRITWNDAVVHEIDVINGSFLLVRPGEYSMAKIEGLDSSGNTVHKVEPQVAPGKESVAPGKE